MKISEASYRAARKYKKENTYQRTVSFNISEFPVELFDECKSAIHKEGLSFNKWVQNKLLEAKNK